LRKETTRYSYFQGDNAGSGAREGRSFHDESVAKYGERELITRKLRYSDEDGRRRRRRRGGRGRNDEQHGFASTIADNTTTRKKRIPPLMMLSIVGNGARMNRNNEGNR
jgi:hypothetical protein